MSGHITEGKEPELGGGEGPCVPSLVEFGQHVYKVLD